jgi:RNA polymerase sigma-70 factor (ECF subfamily)
LDSQTDEQLIQSLRYGNMEAFEELYHRYKGHIYTFCLKLTGDRFLAEDATHDTFLKMHRNIVSLSDVRLFRSWLFTVARNGVFKQLRKQHGNGSLDDEAVWTDETPLSLAEGSNTAIIVAACISALKPEYKEVLLLREYEQRSYEEIATITGNSESSVKSRLFKARKALAEKLKPYFKE